MDDLRLRIFLSSSGDVVKERVLAERVIKGLEAEYAGLLSVETEYWDHEPVFPRNLPESPLFNISESDVHVLLIRDRLGQRFLKDRTSTEDLPGGSAMDLEVEEARAAGLPIYCYRKKNDRLVYLGDDEKAVLDWLAGREAVDLFVERRFGKGEGEPRAGYLTYFDGCAEFEELFEKHLRELISRRLPENAVRRNHQGQALWTKGSPFRGLKYFDFKHAPIFFGRTQAVEDIIETLGRQAALKRCFLLVLGNGGSGKSSLVRAGVLPVLTRPGVIEGVGLWRRAVFRPSDHSGDLFHSLAVSLLEENALPELGADGAGSEELAQYFRNNPSGAAPLIKGGLSQAAFNFARKMDLSGQPEARLVLVVDQLEELFTQEKADPIEAAEFVVALSSMAESGLVWVICTLNSAFYPMCLNYPGLMTLKGSLGQYDLLPPNEKEIRQMIRKPARAAALGFEADSEAETALKNRIVTEMVELLKTRAEGKNCLLMVTGPEGIGKSALIREEIVPLLTGEGEVPGVGLWRRTIFSPGSSSGDLFDGLTAALLEDEALPELTADGSTQEELSEYIRKNPLSAAPLIKGGLSQAASDVAFKTGLSSQPEARLILVIDRLEGALDRQRFDLDQVELFMEVIANLAAMGRVWVICCLSDGFLEQGRLLPHLQAQLAGDGHYDFLAAVKKSEKVPSLVDELVSEAAQNPDRLPCLEFFLSELYRASDRKLLTYQAYRDLGPLPLVLDRRAEEVLEGLGRDGMKAFPLVFHQMVSPGPAGSGTWVAKSVSLETLNAKPRTEALVKAFLKAGLFCAVGKGSAEARVRVAHEALFHGWDRLRQWLETSRISDKVVQIQPRSGPDVRERPGQKARPRTWIRRVGLLLFLVAAVYSGYLGYNLLIAPMVQNGMKVDSGGVQRQASVPKSAVGVMVRRETEKIKAEAAAQLAVTSQELARAKKNLGLAFQEKGLTALAAKLHNEARLYFLSALKRLDQEDSGPERATILGNLMNTPGFPVRLSIADQIGAVNEIEAMAVSRDGRYIAASISDGIIRIWDGITGKEKTNFKAPPGGVTGLVFSPDAKLLALLIPEKKFVVWDLANGREDKAFKDSAETAGCLCFSSSGKTLATGAGDGTIVIWNVDQGEKSTTLKRHNGEVTTLAFSPDDKLLASGSTDRTVIIWSPKPGKMIKAMKGHEESVTRVCFSPDGKLLASGSADGAIRFWDTAKTEEIGVLDGGPGGASSMDFLAETGLLASGGSDRAVRIWDPEQRRLLAVITGQDGPVNQIEFMGGHGLLAVLSGKKAIRVWDLFSLVESETRPRLPGNVTTVRYSPDGRRLAAGTSEKTIHLFDVDTGKQTAVLTGHTGSIYSVCFSPDGRLLASGSGDKTVRLWDLEKGKEKEILKGHQAVVYSVCFSPYGDLLASGSGDKTIRLWEVEGAKEKAVLKGHTFPVLCLAFSPKYKQLASGSSDRTVRLWNIETGEETLVLKGHSSDLYGDVTDLTYSPDGRILASTLGAVTSLGGVVKIWDVKSGNQIDGLRGPQVGMTCVRFSAQGDLLAAGAEDRTILFWDAGTMKEKAVLKTPDGLIQTIAFSPDGRKLVAGNSEGAIESWDLTAIGGPDKIAEMTEKAEKDYNLRLVNIDLTPMTRGNGFSRADLEPAWPESHPFHWLMPAENGDSAAMVRLGLVYEREQRNREALAWYKKAAEAGNRSAEKRLEMLENWMKQKEQDVAPSG